MSRRGTRPTGTVPEAEPADGSEPRVRLFRGDEMSSGQSSSLRRRAGQVAGSPRGGALPVRSENALPPSDDPTRQEIQRRSMRADLASRGGARQTPGSKSKPTGDTFVSRKMRQAERNLPAWEPDDDG